jgi:anti-sigma B factor antagonist
MSQQPGVFAGCGLHKESKLKLSLEVRNRGNAVVVHCQGRIVYRDEAATLSCVVGEAMQRARALVLDLSGVVVIDSAGIGELALLQTWAERKSVSLKLAGLAPIVSTLLELTNLDSVLDIHPSVDAAMADFEADQAGRAQAEEGQICADC